MRLLTFSMLAALAVESMGMPVAWLGASAPADVVAASSVSREWLDRSCVAADLTMAGATLSNALAQAEGLANAGLADKSAVIVFCGEGDFRASVPLGEPYEAAVATVSKNGVQTKLLRRVPLMDCRTYNGRLNLLMNVLKRGFPRREVALVVLPANAEAAGVNGAGLRYDDYVSAARKAGNAWAAAVVDLSSATGTANADGAVSGKTEWKSAWRGRRVAFLGDSITDAHHIGCTSNYWNYLERDLGIIPLVYGVNGHQWKHLRGQAARLSAEHPDDVDEIVVFAGTNDFNANVPMGAWTDGETSFRGRIASVMDYLQGKYPGVTIWLFTPIHRGYATFGANNVQPDETYANTEGLWIGDYVDVVKEAASKWSNVRLIDLNAESGLYPLFDSHVVFFHNGKTDMLHPNNAGHERLAQAIERGFRRHAQGLQAFRGDAIQARLAALPPEGGTLRVEKGEYHFHEADTQTMWLDPSNNKSGEKHVVFPLVGRKNVTIDGCGSTFVFHGRTFPFAATNCTGLTFRNFTVTTHCPSCAGFVVTEKDEKGFSVRFDEDVCPYKVESGNLQFVLDGHVVSTREGRLSLHSVDRLAIFYLVTPDSAGDKDGFPSGFMGVTAEACGERMVRFAYYGDRHPKSVNLPYAVGERVVVNLEEQRYRDVFFFEDCDGVSVENVTIRRFGGMGIVGQRSGNIRIDRLAAVPPKGAKVTLTADILQFVNCYGSIEVTGCTGGGSLDDWINIHGNYLKVVSVSGRRLELRTQHPAHQGFFPYRIGDRVEFVTAHRRDVLGSARVVAISESATDPTACEITVDADAPAGVVPGVLVENATLNPDVTVAGNVFCDYPNIRLSGRGRYLVESNRFERCCSAVLGLDLADYWYESGRILDMTVRNNTVVQGGGFTFGISGWDGSAVDVPKIHGRIVFEGNRTADGGKCQVSVSGVRDFIERP